MTCDGSGTIDPPAGREWLLTGTKPMPCPVCQGPHLEWLLKKMDEDHQVVICSADNCDEEIVAGWLVYAQLTSSELPKLDEAILLCCDKHAEIEADLLRDDGHPTVCLPVCLEDAREIA